MELINKKQNLGMGGIDERVSEKEEEVWAVARRRTRRRVARISGTSSESDTSVVSAVSAVSTASATSEKRKRRKAFLKNSGSDGETGVTAKKKKKEESSPAPARSRVRRDTLPAPEEIRGEMMNLPTAEIGAEIIRQVEEIERVARTSGNLKGTYVRQLKLAARTVKTASVELALRTQSDCDIRKIRVENDSLRDQVRALREEVDKLRAAVPFEGKQSSSTPPAGGTVVVPSLQSDSDCRLEAPSCAQPAGPPTPVAPLAEEGLIARIGRMVDAKLEALRADLTTGPVTRPPLQHERRAEAVAAKERKKVEGKERRGKEREQEEKAGGKEKGEKRQEGRKGKKKNDSPTAAASTPTPPAESVETQAPDTWAKVVGRKAKKAAKKAATPTTPKAPATAPKTVTTLKAGKTSPESKTKDGSKPNRKEGSKLRIPRPPRSAAVTLTLPQGSQYQYSTLMATARGKIDLADVGIESLRMKKAITGALMLEVTGKDEVAKADALPAKMSEVLAPMGAKISRPTKMVEVRITGLEDSVSTEEVAAAIAAASGCKPEAIRVGPIRSSESRLGSAWVRCPQAAVKKLVEKGRVKIGWSTARVTLLQQRPLQCFKCLEQGHVRAKCPNAADRSGRCYACGVEGHLARDCPASTPHCPLCSDLGRPATHRMGGKACSPRGTSKKSRKGGQSVPSSSTSPTVLPAKGTTDPAPFPSPLVKEMEMAAATAPIAVEPAVTIGREEAMEVAEQ